MTKKKQVAKSHYQEQLILLQVELLKVQQWVKSSQQRIAILFEGRDAAGKGGAIKRFTEHLNPRGARIVALDKPSDREQSEWYFQRYLTQLPSAGEITLFDRSWYNRAGVEKVMGFTTQDKYELFLKQAPELERMLIDDGLYLFKYWFAVSRKEQQARFEERKRNPLKNWKLSPIDVAAQEKWEQYSEARDRMLAETHCPFSPWLIVAADDKRAARLNVIRHFLRQLPYPDKNERLLALLDEKIVYSPNFPTLTRREQDNLAN